MENRKYLCGGLAQPVAEAAQTSRSSSFEQE
jgi:hypothetical protein